MYPGTLSKTKVAGIHVPIPPKSITIIITFLKENLLLLQLVLYFLKSNLLQLL